MHFSQSWSMLSFLLVFPMTQSMTAAFNRRERAIQFMQAFKCSCMALFLSHADWDFYNIPSDLSEPVNGLRALRLNKDHVARLTRALINLIQLVKLILLSPSVHVMHLLFDSKVEVVEAVSRNLRKEVAKVLQDISLLGEELKESGVPASEATRIRQFSYTAMDALSNLIAIKTYHTPLGLRAFTRVFILLLPWMFGPYWAAMSASVGLGFTITFSVVQSLALKSLFIMRFALEDPFIVGNIALPRRAKDAIDVQGELEELKEELEMLLARKQRGKGDTQEDKVFVDVVAT